MIICSRCVIRSCSDICLVLWRMDGFLMTLWSGSKILLAALADRRFWRRQIMLIAPFCGMWIILNSFFELLLDVMWCFLWCCCAGVYLSLSRFRFDSGTVHCLCMHLLLRDTLRNMSIDYIELDKWMKFTLEILSLSACRMTHTQKAISPPSESIL